MRLFRRREQEQIETRTYTDMRVAAAQAAVTGTSLDPAGLAAVQAAANQWARALAAAELSPDNMVTAAVTPDVLYDVGRALVLDGEAVYLIVADRDGVRLRRAASWDVYGVDVWRYRVTLAGPSGTEVRRSPAAGVLHWRINTDRNEPHRGRSPLVLATLTGQTAAGTEKQLGEQAAANHGYVIPAPTGGLSKGDSDDLKSDVTGLRGKTALVPGMESFGDHRPGSHPGNWQSRRVGMDPPAPVVDLREQSALSILGACGVPVELLAGRSDGTARREAWRQFLHGTIQPVADLMAAELAAKLEVPAAFTFDRLFASDIQGRGRAFQSLVSGGLSVADAARATGVQVSTAPESPV